MSCFCVKFFLIVMVFLVNVVCGSVINFFVVVGFYWDWDLE